MPAAAPILGQIALNLAIGVGASLLANALRPQQKNPASATTRHTSTQMKIGEAVPYSAVFGVARASGALHYVNEYGDGDNYHLQLLIRIGVGEHDGMEAFLVDETVRTLSGSNGDAKGKKVDDFIVSGTPYMWVKTYRGAPGQTADAELIDKANPATRWTSDYKMTGWAYMIVTIRYNSDLFGSSLPDIGSVWRGLRLYDFRDEDAIWGDSSTYAYTKNPAVIRYNFRRGIWVNGVRVLGQGFSSYSCDTAYYAAAANICDELVDYPDGSGEVARYEYGREVGDDEEKLSVLTELEESMCGSSFKRGGADAPLPGAQVVPVMTLNNTDRVRGNSVRADLRGAVSSKKTYIHGQFVSEATDWSTIPYTPRKSTTLEERIGGRRVMTLDQPYEHLEDRAQARAEISIRRQLFPANRVETFGPKAFRLEPGDAVTRVSEWGSKVMIVESTKMLDDRTGVTITLTEWDDSIVPASDEPFVDVPDTSGLVQGAVGITVVLSGLSVVAISRVSSGVTLPFAQATWTQITDPNVDQVMFRFWPTALGDVVGGQTEFADARLQAGKVWGPLQPATAYSGYAIPIRRDGRTTIPVTFTFTTGALVTVSTPGPATITKEMLNGEVTGAVNTILGHGEGSLEYMIAHAADFANGVAGTALSSATMADGKAVAAQTSADLANTAVNAATDPVKGIYASAKEAWAEDIRLSAVDTLAGLGTGLFGIKVVGTPTDIHVQLSIVARLKVKALDPNDQTVYDTGIIIDLSKTGEVIESQIIYQANKQYWVDDKTGNKTAPMQYVAGELTLTLANMLKLRSGMITSNDDTSHYGDPDYLTRTGSRYIFLSGTRQGDVRL